jgi:hypothetical protein
MEVTLATHIVILNEIVHPQHPRRDWHLCLQWGRYQYDNGDEPQNGYRFIWRQPATQEQKKQGRGGSLQPARGQARIPSLSDAELLIRLAREAGWGDENADE